MTLTVRHFRLLLMASLVTGLFGGGVDLVFPALMPDAFHQAQEAHDAALSAPHLVLLFVLWLALGLMILASYYGLYMLRSWAPRVAVVGTALGLLVGIAAGSWAQSGLAVAACYLSSYLWGAALVFTVFAPFSAHFRRPEG